MTIVTPSRNPTTPSSGLTPSHSLTTTPSLTPSPSFSPSSSSSPSFSSSPGFSSTPSPSLTPTPTLTSTPFVTGTFICVTKSNHNLTESSIVLIVSLVLQTRLKIRRRPLNCISLFPSSVVLFSLSCLSSSFPPPMFIEKSVAIRREVAYLNCPSISRPC